MVWVGVRFSPFLPRSKMAEDESTTEILAADAKAVAN
jgi:hypothetical protein